MTVKNPALKIKESHALKDTKGDKITPCSWACWR